MAPYYSRRVPRDRLPPETFDLPVEKIRSGYYTDAYFNFARSALLQDGRRPRVVMQVFQKHRSVLGGVVSASVCLLRPRRNAKHGSCSRPPMRLTSKRSNSWRRSSSPNRSVGGCSAKARAPSFDALRAAC